MRWPTVPSPCCSAALPADDGAAAVVAQHVEAAAGAHTHNGGLVRGEVGQGLDAGVKAGHQLVHLVFQTKHGGDGSGVLADALHHAQLAQEIMENELVMGTDAYKNGNIVYLAHPAVWYTAEGGITALDIMLQDLESKLLG